MDSFAMKKEIGKLDYLIILGVKLLNGDRIGHTLKNRLEATIEYIEKNDHRGKIIVSGGRKGSKGLTEADVMKKYLMDRGINNIILIENKSTNTFENLSFSKIIIEIDSGRDIEDINIKIFTNRFHSFRSKFLSKRVGFNTSEVYNVATPWYLIPVYYIREIIAIGKSVLLDK